MTKLFSSILCVLMISCFFESQMHGQLATPDTIIKGLGDLNHPVTTSNKQAQQFFNQGLTLVYAFNHEAAYTSFEMAAKLDPNLAMAYWGMALSLGSNINTPINSHRELQAYNLIQKALSLIDSQITGNEKEYIQALASRYTNAEKPDYKQLDLDYNKAMKQLMENYPEDLDAATLYAESGMNLNPWNLWTKEGKSKPGTDEVIAVLESVLSRDPMHIGANHYYIHAVEGSDHPERALLSAERLPNLVPESGHLMHMPSHIYLIVGDYHRAAVVNEDAVRIDREFIKANGLKTSYPVHYMSHNLYFLSRAYSLEGNFEKAKKSADELYEFLRPEIDKMPDLEYYMTGPMLILLRFNKSAEVLQLPKPAENMRGTVALYHFSRGVTFARMNDMSSAKEEKRLFLEQKNLSSQDLKFGYNMLSSILDIADHYLDAVIAKAEGRTRDSIQHLIIAVQIQDNLGYNEPPDWFFSVRESLGAAYFLEGNYEDAQKTFKEDLRRHPRNGRSLFGLQQTLMALNKKTDSFWVEEEFKTAWQYADTQLSVEQLY